MNKNGIYLRANDILAGKTRRAYKCANSLGFAERQRRFYSAGIVSPSDISDVQAVTILDQLLGLARPQYNLRQLLRPIAMDNLTMRIDVATTLAGQEKVPPLVEAEISKNAYTAVNFDLWKNVVHVAAADEAQMKAAHPILNISIQDGARDIARMENKQIAEILEGNITEKVAGSVYSDWGAQTSGVSDTNPFDAIGASVGYIEETKGYPVNFMAMHPTLYRKFILNTWVRELVHAGMATLGANGGSFTLPGYPDIRVVRDIALTETPTASVGPIVGNIGAGVLGLGPTMAAAYRDEKAGYDAYIVRTWLEPKVVIDDGFDMICT